MNHTQFSGRYSNWARNYVIYSYEFGRNRDLHFYLYAFHGNCMKISNLNNIQYKCDSLALHLLVVFLHWVRDIRDDTLKRNQFTLAHAHIHILELMTLRSVTSFGTVKHSRFHRVYRNSWVFVVIFEFVIIEYLFSLEFWQIQVLSTHICSAR